MILGRVLVGETPDTDTCESDQKRFGPQDFLACGVFVGVLQIPFLNSGQLGLAWGWLRPGHPLLAVGSPLLGAVAFHPPVAPLRVSNTVFR